jgi:glutamate racemase
MDGFAPIGVFDSGVGGLSVLRAIRAEMAEEPVIYLGDQAHVPYGPRPVEQARSFSETITKYLLGRGSKIIVVACNTASAAALHYLRERFPDVPFIGMEPAVKPAAERTRSGKVGVLATPATFQGALYASVVERFASEVVVLQHTCPGLVAQIEKGDIDGPQTRAILEEALLPMLAQGIDTVVLGCTHYPFVIPLIEQICGPNVRVIDPAPAVAKQTRRVLDAAGRKLRAHGPGPVLYLTTGEARPFRHLLRMLIGEEGTVQELDWNGERELFPVQLSSAGTFGAAPQNREQST